MRALWITTAFVVAVCWGNPVSPKGKVLDETVLSNPKSFDYNWDDDLTKQAELNDVYDEVVPYLPQYEVFKNSKYQGHGRVPIVTRKVPTWSTPRPRGNGDNSDAWTAVPPGGVTWRSQTKPVVSKSQKTFDSIVTTRRTTTRRTTTPRPTTTRKTTTTPRPTTTRRTTTRRPTTTTTRRTTTPRRTTRRQTTTPRPLTTRRFTHRPTFYIEHVTRRTFPTRPPTTPRPQTTTRRHTTTRRPTTTTRRVTTRRTTTPRPTTRRFTPRRTNAPWTTTTRRPTTTSTWIVHIERPGFSSQPRPETTRRTTTPWHRTTTTRKPRTTQRPYTTPAPSRSARIRTTWVRVHSNDLFVKSPPPILPPGTRIVHERWSPTEGWSPTADCAWCQGHKVTRSTKERAHYRTEVKSLRSIAPLRNLKPPMIQFGAEPHRGA